MKDVFGKASNWIIVGMIAAITFVGVVAYPSMMALAKGNNASLARLNETQKTLILEGFDDDSNRQGYEVIALIDAVRDSNNPRYRVVVTTRSTGATTTYGYATPTTDTYVAYTNNDPTDADFIVESDNYECSWITTGPNNTVVGIQATQFD